MKRSPVVATVLLLAMMLAAAPVAAATTSYSAFRVHEMLAIGGAHRAIQNIQDTLFFDEPDLAAVYVTKIASAQLKSSLSEQRWLSSHKPRACYREVYLAARAAWSGYRIALKLAYRWSLGDHSVSEGSMTNALKHADLGFTLFSVMFPPYSCH